MLYCYVACPGHWSRDCTLAPSEWQRRPAAAAAARPAPLPATAAPPVIGMSTQGTPARLGGASGGYGRGPQPQRPGDGAAQQRPMGCWKCGKSGVGPTWPLAVTGCHPACTSQACNRGRQCCFGGQRASLSCQTLWLSGHWARDCDAPPDQQLPRGSFPNGNAQNDVAYPNSCAHSTSQRILWAAKSFSVSNNIEGYCLRWLLCASAGKLARQPQPRRSLPKGPGNARSRLKT